MTIALKLSKVSKSFTIGKRMFGSPRGEIKAVQAISLEVRRGETLGIVGESGCGKSTLARMLVGLISPDSGTIEINGKPLNKLDRARFGSEIQYMFQDPLGSLNPRKTIRQIMHAPLKHLHNLPAESRAKKIDEIFSAITLHEEFLDRYPHEFSGGQAQRIGIARALAAQASILILDEPVSALDVSVQAQVLNFLAQLKQQFDLTYLFISHDLTIVQALSDRIAVLYFGSVVEISTAKNIFTSPKHPYTKLLTDSAPIIGRTLVAPEGQETELPDPLNAPNGCPFKMRCTRATAKCSVELPQLSQHSEDGSVACHHPL